MDLQRIQPNRHKLLYGSLLCIQHFVRRWLYGMDFDIFLVYMQDGQDIRGQLYIQVEELQK